MVQCVESIVRYGLCCACVVPVLCLCCACAVYVKAAGLRRRVPERHRFGSPGGFSSAVCRAEHAVIARAA
eukprot:8407429-Alexandrium_andersonii.AAC.1